LATSAGTGKSWLLTKIIWRLQDMGRRVQVTAATGIAAIPLGGTTLHRFGGIGLGKLALQETWLQLVAKPAKVKVLRATQVLVVDEVSMTDGAYFSLLDAILRRARDEPDRPFGGLQQLIVCGDFFQLPPVDDGAAFAFETGAWAELFTDRRNVVVLNNQHRQTLATS